LWAGEHSILIQYLLHQHLDFGELAVVGAWHRWIFVVGFNVKMWPFSVCRIQQLSGYYSIYTIWTSLRISVLSHKHSNQRHIFSGLLRTRTSGFFFASVHWDFLNAGSLGRLTTLQFQCSFMGSYSFSCKHFWSN
jgi:hypothetical protein